MYLHVGMDKTGTSAIQWMLDRNRDYFLKGSNYYYPKTGLWKDCSHHPFAFSIVGMFGYSKEHLEHLMSDLKNELSGKDRVILSSECLFKSTLKEDFNLFWESLNDRFHTIKIFGKGRIFF